MKLTIRRGDIFGGITAGIIALPLALGFGVASGLGAAAGLYGAIIVCLFACIFGGTPTQISGPTGPMTVVVASIAAVHADNLAVAFALIALSGVLQIIYGTIKIGRFIHRVPNSVISGFMTGIGCIVIKLQVGSFPNEQSIILGALTLLLVFFIPKRVARAVPPPLLALVACTLVGVLLHFQVDTIGAIPSGLPQMKLAAIDLATFWSILPAAVGLSVLGSIDSLLTSLVADKKTDTVHDSDRELIGQGLGNMFAGIFGGLAGAGATMRTMVNIESGGATRVSGVVHSLVLILILLAFAPLAQMIPIAVLAGILIKVGVDIVDYDFFKTIRERSKTDIIVMLTVLLITVFGNLIAAVAAGIALHVVLNKLR